MYFSTEYKIAPRAAEVTIKIIGEGFLPNIFLYPKAISAIKAKMISPITSGVLSPSFMLSKRKILLINKSIDVPKIKPTTQGRTPPRKAFTAWYCRKFFTTAEINNMIMNEGKTTPRVAHNEPTIPPKTGPSKPHSALPVIDPTKVAILTAMGPGVDSDTAIILRSSDSVNHPLAKTLSKTIEIMA